ncbi:DUF4160 domain-containing protein [Neorhizobium galegae]|uniref:DUF4160 domain-containing protein n=1 Tax=Neorhizobium galegae TaxID=399 RepID=UPI0006229239|nr:DUF4160 domain-containing protein [Neorhizobium galegae]MCQ1764980.1 DUF4160 domain-containing protein [Neorhizobium galegae]MCQ1848898.1 DUF4160 domain-containing protein [Neorhizobium galegae]CDZ43310.1 Hypothetical protein NGAL_HAMBI1146_60830 [Neorhizobium galegae bv. officinalis]
MPTIIKLGNLKIQIFADDHHPPHFHIVTPDHEVLVRLSDLEILAGSIDRQSLHRALAWVRKNRKVLNEAWERLNER